MIKHEKSIRYKFLACLLAVTLVFGLSALPAFAVPDDASEGDLAAQTEEAPMLLLKNQLPHSQQ